jgi:hypothetical protein
MSDHILKGKVLTGIELASDNKAMRFLSEGEPILARADGDCCSESWIEHIEIPVSFPAKVLSVEGLYYDESEESDYEVIVRYGLKVVTDKGDLVIDYRNSSNGYYGGDLVFGDDYFYGGVWGQNESNNEWQPVLGDK